MILTKWKSLVAVNVLDVFPMPSLILFARNAVFASGDLLMELTSLEVTSSLTKYRKSRDTTRPSSHMVYSSLWTVPVVRNLSRCFGSDVNLFHI